MAATTVVVATSQPTTQARARPATWTKSPCDCCDEADFCIFALFCPCLAMGANRSIANNLNGTGTGQEECFNDVCCVDFLIWWCCYGAFHCCYAAIERSNYARAIGHAHQDDCGEMCAGMIFHTFWSPCTLTQEHMDLKAAWATAPPRQVMGTTVVVIGAQGQQGAPGQQMYYQPAPGQQQMVYQPAYGQPMQGVPMGQPMAMGQPMGQPMYAQPYGGQQAYAQGGGQPAYAQAAYAQPAYPQGGQPAYPQGAYAQPAPAYGQPAYGQPVGESMAV